MPDPNADLSCISENISLTAPSCPAAQVEQPQTALDGRLNSVPSTSPPPAAAESRLDAAVRRLAHRNFPGKRFVTFRSRY